MTYFDGPQQADEGPSAEQWAKIRRDAEGGEQSDVIKACEAAELDTRLARLFLAVVCSHRDGTAIESKANGEEEVKRESQEGLRLLRGSQPTTKKDCEEIYAETQR